MRFGIWICQNKVSRLGVCDLGFSGALGLGSDYSVRGLGLVLPAVGVCDLGLRFGFRGVMVASEARVGSKNFNTECLSVGLGDPRLTYEVKVLGCDLSLRLGAWEYECEKT